MNRRSGLGLLCLASTASLAQTAVTDFRLAPSEAKCPAGIRATLEKSRNPLAPQRLEITLGNAPLPVSSARITVHGIAPVADRPMPSENAENLDLTRVMPARTYTSTAQEETPKRQGQTTELDDILGTIGSAPVVVRSTWPQRWYGWVIGFTAVHSIDLDSVSYGDGTSWHASTGETCRVSLAAAP